MAHPLITVTGVKAIDNELAQIEPKLQKKAITRALNRTSQIVHNAARVNAAYNSSEIPATIKKRAAKRSRSRLGRSVVAGSDDLGQPAYYAVWNELGTNDRWQKSGHYVGSIDAVELDLPFLRPALYDNEYEIHKEFKRQVLDAIKLLNRHHGRFTPKKLADLLK